ncbi:MAG: peptide-methionine (S)-S-oxide reductase MsrA [Hyphomicrobium sp.]|uniref:peptide-methionine (S)-S-oxide reductase MsrA n=1 Tax=Hyphomicrobium sp. TaxID=82 RepID=UPI0025C15135|nr:peptide-methionine (S)-S-oxide reductase MsrA [Hyphomicrobium sp.]MBZ0209973.1 peptide-methionine (S)-S-oxide reductase MsrA [Hyphomicrobium sp.]
MLRIAVPVGAALALAAVLVIANPSNGAAPAPQASAVPTGLEVATFASGCFWCTESDFDKVPGVKETISGFMGGQTKNPTYAQVSMGDTGHAEAVQLKYDPKQVSYQQLLDYYWRHVDLLDGGGQFCDRGSQYRPVIFAHTGEQKKLAEDSKAALESSKRFDAPIAVQIVDAGPFTPAEDYHQNYYETNPLKYRYYRYACGRDARLKEIWGAEADTAMH